MSELGIEIKVKEKNFKISLNLMQIEDQILPGAGPGTETGEG
jgi:hypothetical protein